jgi:hypothetical protein
MCCFSGPVDNVQDTKIFARLTGRGTQFLVYQMHYESKGDNAIILPLPVATPAMDESVEFINLQGYSHFFGDLAVGFPKKRPLELFGSKGIAGSAKAEPLKVKEVGDYVASFVPSVADFPRLDQRFRIRPEIWAQLPSCVDYGFAVFQLKIRAGKPHPMAFEWKTRHTDHIFFPTIHIHDGEVHAESNFDHTLYLQDPSFDSAVDDYQDRDIVDQATGFVRSEQPAIKFTSPHKAMNILVPEQLIHRRRLLGTLPNDDLLVPFAQASIVPPRARRWGFNTGAALIGAAGLSWIIARRRNLKQRSGAAS